MTTYKPISGKENDFKLQDTTRAIEEELHKLQVRFKGISIDERKAICEYEGWVAEEHIPELTQDLRIGISALKELVDRSPVLDGIDPLRANLEKLIDGRILEHEIVDPVLPDEYWFELAKLLFKNFKCEDPKQINFKVVEQARKDFFA
jgi:hypothetical protein